MSLRRLLAVTVVAGLLTGCGKDPGALSGGPPDPPGPAVTADESARILHDYVLRYNKAVTSGDGRAWRALTTGALAAVTGADLDRGHGRPPRLGRIALANPVMYVPRIAAAPRWFGVAALERRGRTERPVFLLFAAQGAAGAWRLASRSYFTGRPPRIATDGQGYAVAADPADLPSAQAAYLDGGDNGTFTPGGPAGRWRAAERRRESALRARGVRVAGRFTPAPYPLYALRTKDGGALVWYTLRRTVTYTASRRATRVAVPRDVSAYLGGKAGRRVVATWMWRTTAYLPARGPASVVIENADLVSARSS